MNSGARATLVAIMLLSWWAVAPGAAQDGAEPDKRIGILLAAGDISACYHKDRKYKQVAELIQQEVGKAHHLPVAVLALGDLAYSNRKKNGKLAPPFYADCFEEFKATWGAHYDRLLPVPGNHDYSDDPPNAAVYRAYFQETLAALGADKDGHFYAITFPQGHADGWLLAALNFYRDRQRQEEWLRSARTNSKAKCVLLFAHPFLLSSGHHGRKFPNWTYKDMQPFAEIALQQGATLLVTAHDHDYERFARHDAAGNEDVDGLGSFVAGTGGAHLYHVPDDKRHPLSRAFQNKSAGLLKLELYPDGYTSSFVAIDGSAPDVQTHWQECAKRPAAVDPQF